jgi:hypothetical protein
MIITLTKLLLSVTVVGFPDSYSAVAVRSLCILFFDVADPSALI